MKLFQTTQSALKNRVSWTVYYLLAGLLARPNKGAIIKLLVLVKMKIN